MDSQKCSATCSGALARRWPGLALVRSASGAGSSEGGGIEVATLSLWRLAALTTTAPPKRGRRSFASPRVRPRRWDKAPVER